MKMVENDADKYFFFFLRYLANEISMVFYYKGNNSKMGDSWDKKTTWITYFFIRNPYMKFQNISMVLLNLCYATNGQNLQRAITPTKFH